MNMKQIDMLPEIIPYCRVEGLSGVESLRVIKIIKRRYVYKKDVVMLLHKRQRKDCG